MKLYCTCLALLSFLTLSVPARDTVLGKVLDYEFPPAEEEITYNDFRDGKHLSVNEAIKFADEFLNQTFGDDFKPTVVRVGFGPMLAKNGKRWSRAVSYQHPEVEGVFRVFLSGEGKPMMSVSDKR